MQPAKSVRKVLPSNCTDVASEVSPMRVSDVTLEPAARSVSMTHNAEQKKSLQVA